MNKNQFDMNDGRANFMEAVEETYGRVDTITRKELVKFTGNWVVGQTGPLRTDIPLRWPTWLVSSDAYRTDTRGTFRLPWDDYNQFRRVELEQKNAQKEAEAQKTARRLERDQIRKDREARATEQREAKLAAREAKLAARVAEANEKLARKVSRKEAQLAALEAKRQAQEAKRAEKRAEKAKKFVEVSVAST